MSRVTMYWRQRGNERAETRAFDDAELSRRHIARGPDGAISEREALLVVNDWNRLAAQIGVAWRYWI